MGSPSSLAEEAPQARSIAEQPWERRQSPAKAARPGGQKGGGRWAERLSEFWKTFAEARLVAQQKNRRGDAKSTGAEETIVSLWPQQGRLKDRPWETESQASEVHRCVPGTRTTPRAATSPGAGQSAPGTGKEAVPAAWLPDQSEL